MLKNIFFHMLRIIALILSIPLLILLALEWLVRTIIFGVNEYNRLFYISDIMDKFIVFVEFIESNIESKNENKANM